jgi:hypothetical protein
MRRKLSFALIGIVAFSAALSATALAVSLLDDGGGSAAPASAGQIRWTIEDAQQFREFPLYWLGESYEGLPLTDIVRAKYEYEVHPQAVKFVGQEVMKEDLVGFVYGTCDPGNDGGCAPPLVIRVEPYCVNPNLKVKKAFTPGPPFDIRGALAQEEAGKLVVKTDVAVTISGAEIRGDNALAIRAANDLQAVAAGGPLRSDPLPPSGDGFC